jgi:D-alanyl-D-alanine carboxypeptidase
MRISIITIFFGLNLFILGGCVGNSIYTPDMPNKNMGSEIFGLQILLDSSIIEFMLPGVQAGYLKSGKNPVIASSGTFDFKHKKTPIKNDHSFRIGSTTKMIIAVLFCKFAQEGKVDLNETIDQWLPAYPEGSTITLRNLLNHTSGINETLFNNPGIVFRSTLNHKKLWNPAEIISILSGSYKKIPIDQRSFIYSNNNYLLLGVIAEEIEKKVLALILEDEFFIPLNMNHTTLLPVAEQSTYGLVPGYDEYIPFGPHLISADYTSWDSLIFSAGAISSNSSDLLIWMDELFHYRIISKEYIDQMLHWTKTTNNGRDESMVAYGLGLSLYELGESRLIGHPGAGFGGECFLFWDPIEDCSYIVMYNLSRKDNPAGKSILEEMILLASNE